MVALLALMLITTTDLEGIWQYDGYIYEDRRYPLPNPDLQLFFTFYSDGSSRLFWSRKNEPGFCESKSTFSIDQDLLLQQVVWVNPGNAQECQNDPEMQVGHQSATPFRLVGDELHLMFNLDEKDFIYVLKKILMKIAD